MSLSGISPQLLSDLLAPVIDQVPEHLSDCNTVCFRAHIKNSINTPSQVRAALPLLVSMAFGRN